MTTLYRIYAFETNEPNFAKDDCSELDTYTTEPTARLMMEYRKSQSKVGLMLVRISYDGTTETGDEIIETWSAPADGPDDGP